MFRYDDIGNDRAGNTMSYRNIYNSFSGRIGRKQFWFAAIPLFIAAFIVLMLSLYAVRETDLWVFRLNKVVVMLIFMYPALAIGVKRLHDRGRSGWWAALVLVAVLAIWPEPGRTFGPLAFLFGIVVFWAAVELGAMPGEAGANRYGPNPLRPPLAV